jgi:hypothetical protein
LHIVALNATALAVKWLGESLFDLPLIRFFPRPPDLIVDFTFCSPLPFQPERRLKFDGIVEI